MRSAPSCCSRPRTRWYLPWVESTDLLKLPLVRGEVVAAVRVSAIVGMLLIVACVLGTGLLLLSAWFAGAGIDPGDEEGVPLFLLLGGLWALASGGLAWLLLRPARGRTHRHRIMDSESESD